MARSSSANGAVVRAPKPVISAEEADALMSKVGALIIADMNIQNVIDIDVKLLHAFDTSFEHPLYQLRTKLDGIRGKAARQLAAYSRASKKAAREAKKAQTATA